MRSRTIVGAFLLVGCVVAMQAQISPARFEVPTTGAIAEGSFYLIANTQLGKIDPTTGKLLVPVSELKPVVVLQHVLTW